MKVLTLNRRDIRHPLTGGAERVTNIYAQAWIEQGWDVTWLSGNFKKGKSYEEISDIKFYRFGNAYTIYLLAPFIYWLKFRGQFDLVIDQIHGIPFFTPLWAFRSKKTAFIHGVAQDIWNIMYPFPLNLLGRLMERLYFRLYQTVPFMTVSNSTKKDLIAFGIPSRSIAVFPNGIEIGSSTMREKKEEKLTLIFVGRLVKMKGIEDVLSVFASVEEKYPDSQLWIVGSGNPEYVEKLQKRAALQKIEKKVKFFGYIDEKQKNSLYQRAHFLIHTSMREGFGLVVLEANAHGTPAIVYDSPGLKDVVQNGINGYRIDIERKDKMAEKILEVFKNKKQYASLSHSSFEHGKRFNWKTITKDIVSYINKVV